MRFPCCEYRQPPQRPRELERVEAALLRLFIRYKIPPLPRECAIRAWKYQRDLADLIDRSNLPKDKPGALTKAMFDTETARLKAKATADYRRLEADPYSYRYWQPTAEDLRRLSIRQAITAHKPKPADPDILIPLPKKGRGRPETGALWKYAQYAEMGLRKAEDDLRKFEAENKLPVGKGKVKQIDAAAAAVKMMNVAAEDGKWTGIVPSEGTIEGLWRDMFPDDPKDTPPLPPDMQFYYDALEHEEEVEHAVDRLGLLGVLPPEFEDFADWAFAKVAAKVRVPTDIVSWRQPRWLTFIGAALGNDMPSLISSWGELLDWRKWLDTRPAMARAESKVHKKEGDIQQAKLKRLAALRCRFLARELDDLLAIYHDLRS